ncbi:MAG: hypothetical protein QNK37_05095, partial [Acidobacteriota bacterium]|nr:hypothetical protein [Acidobacteriota bacterium]
PGASGLHLLTPKTVTQACLPETLDITLSTLDNLQATGRRIGIISHLGSIADRLGVRVKPVRAANGSSRIETTTG